MKKILSTRVFLFLLLASVSLNIEAQSLLGAIDLDLGNGRTDLFSTTDVKNRQFWIVTGSGSRTYAFAFSENLFLRDSISFDRPDQDFDHIAGQSFDTKGNPSIYWASSDYKKIFSHTIDISQKTILKKSYVFEFENEELLTTFSAEGRYFLLTVAKDSDQLIFYDFSQGLPNMKIVDMSSFRFQTPRGQNLSLLKLFRAHPPQFIDPAFLTPLYIAAEKCKIYPVRNKLLFTYDENPSVTRVFEISLEDFSVREKRIEQPSLEEAGLSNSFFCDGKLFQFKANKMELKLSSVDLESEQLLYSYQATSEKEISFKNSPLLAESPDGISELSTTKKFLRRIDFKSPAVSVYRHKDGKFLLTAGAVQDYRPAGDIILGTTLGVGVAVAGGSGNFDFLDDDPMQRTYFFESIFSEKFEHLNLEQSTLYFDVLNRFLSEAQLSDFTLSSLGKFKVLTYYDHSVKKVLSRKFSDVKILD